MTDNKFEGVKIKRARMHSGTSLFILGTGQIGPELSNEQNGLHKAVDMTLIEGGIVVVQGTGKSGKYTEFVPITSFLQLTPSL